MSFAKLSIGQSVSLACLWEATAAKPGNVYRGADFADMSYSDFLTSSACIGPVFDHSQQRSVGQLVLEAVQAMRRAVHPNTHLGCILLFAPLVKAAERHPDAVIESVSLVTSKLTIEDSRLAYAAIRLVSPGGLGSAEQADVAEEPTIPLCQAMQLAADRDLVARQYANGFAEVQQTANRIQQAAAEVPLGQAIMLAHVHQMADTPDTLIARKCGSATAQEAADRAAAVLAAGALGSEAFHARVADLDFWLRSDGHRRNPGATADVIAAALLVLLLEDRLTWPVRF